MRTEFTKLTNAEEIGASIVEIKMRDANTYGVASSVGIDRVAVYYGNDDGSDDKIISAEEFNTNWQVTSIFFEEE